MKTKRGSMEGSRGGARNSAQTRRLILEATVRVLSNRGSAATIADVATAAGVSKGGVLHHFGSRHALLLSATEYTLNRLRKRVMEQVDLGENHPGRVLRAYVRVVTADGHLPGDPYESAMLWKSVQMVPGVTEVLRRDSAAWTESFAQDGLHVDRVSLVRHAAEGLAEARGSEPGLPVEMIERERRALLHLTLSNGPLEVA